MPVFVNRMAICKIVTQILPNICRSSTSKSMSILSKPPQKIPDIQINILGKDDKEKSLEFLHKYFDTDEPLNEILHVIHMDYTMIDNGLSLISLHNRNVVGICINEIIDRSYFTRTQCVGPDDKVGLLLDYVAEQARIFDMYPGSEKALKLTYGAVHRDYRGYGILGKLISESKSLAKANGCGFVTGDCTSYYSIKCLEKEGFQLRYSLPYANYKPSGEVVFKPKPPHDRINVYTMDINP